MGACNRKEMGAGCKEGVRRWGGRPGPRTEGRALLYRAQAHGVWFFSGEWSFGKASNGEGDDSKSKGDASEQSGDGA